MQNPFDDFPMPDLDTFDPEGPVPLHECCICLGQPVNAIIAIEAVQFPFCKNCEHRSTLLQRGQRLCWPAVRIAGVTGKYSLDNSAQAYVLTAIQGTDERVIELLDALDEYEQREAA